MHLTTFTLISSENRMFGKTLLRRKEADYFSGFGFVRSSLTELITQVELLHMAERQYADSLKFDRRKHSYLLGRIAAKLAIINITSQQPDSIYIDNGIFQFPIVNQVVGQSIQVSISHCDDIAVALAFPEKHPIAIDIERINEEQAQAIQQQLSHHEQFILSGYGFSPGEGNTMLWTIKEALSKILRTGLMMDLKILEVSTLKVNGDFWESTFTCCKQYKGITRICDSYVISIVTAANTEITGNYDSPDVIFSHFCRFLLNKKG